MLTFENWIQNTQNKWNWARHNHVQITNDGHFVLFYGAESRRETIVKAGSYLTSNALKSKLNAQGPVTVLKVEVDPDFIMPRNGDFCVVTQDFPIVGS